MSRITWPETAVVTVFGSGFSPIAPATVASAVTCAILWFVPAALRWPGFLLLIPTFFLGVWLSERAISHFDPVTNSRFQKLRRPNPKKDDPDQVVIDEFVGQWITLLAVGTPIAASSGFDLVRLKDFALAFIAFRIFDIYKPLGIDCAQRARAGWGVMLDDVLAGLWGAGMLLIVRLAPLLIH